MGSVTSSESNARKFNDTKLVRPKYVPFCHKMEQEFKCVRACNIGKASTVTNQWKLLRLRSPLTMKNNTGMQDTLAHSHWHL